MIMALQLKRKIHEKKGQVAVKRIWPAIMHKALHKNEKEGWHQKMRRGLTWHSTVWKDSGG